MSEQSATYCNEPWRTIHYDDTATMGPCCTFRGGRNPDLHSVTEYWNSEWLADIRNKMLTGQRVAGCRNCYVKEDRGEHSQRTEKNKKYGVVLEPRIDELSLSFGNICNKTCNICRPQRSHLVAKEYRLIPADSAWMQNKVKLQPTTPRAMQRDYSGLYTASLPEYQEALLHANTIVMDGGEPFIVSQCTEILEYMVQHGMTDKKIKVSTNGSATQYQLDLLSKFRQVSFHLSIDGIHDLYSVVRPPHDWSWWNQQHDMMLNHQVIITYACVAHAFNVHQLPDILDYFVQQQQKKPNSLIFFSQLNDQPELGCDVVPDHIILESIHQLEQRMPQLSAKNRTVVEQLIVHLRKSQQINKPENREMLTKYVELFGPVKNIDFQSHIPWSLNFE
jgi:hypothetical protein